MSSTLEEVADRYFAAVERNDVAVLEDLYTRDFQHWHSFDNKIKDRAVCLEMIDKLGHVATKRYRLIESIAKDDRVVRRYELTLNAPGRWTNHHVDLVFFLRIAGDQIASIEEYIDSRDAADAIAAVRDAGLDLAGVQHGTAAPA